MLQRRRWTGRVERISDARVPGRMMKGYRGVNEQGVDRRTEENILWIVGDKG